MGCRDGPTYRTHDLQVCQNLMLLESRTKAELDEMTGSCEEDSGIIRDFLDLI